MGNFFDESPSADQPKPASKNFFDETPAPTPAPTVPPVPPGYQSPSWLPGAGWLHKMSNIFDDSATFGAIDPATAKVGELLRSAGVSNATPDAATLRAQTSQNRTDVGPLASGAADIAGYAVGGGGRVGETWRDGLAAVYGPAWEARRPRTRLRLAQEHLDTAEAWKMPARLRRLAL